MLLPRPLSNGTVYVKLGWMAVEVDQHPVRLFFCLVKATARQGQDLLYDWLCILRQSLSSLSANFPPALCPPPRGRPCRTLEVKV